MMAAVRILSGMTTSGKIAAAVACVAVISGVAIAWRSYHEKAKLAEAARVAHVRAERGDVKAQANLGTMYYYGKGVPQDYAEAVRWYRRAAEQGYAKAQYDLGFMYAQDKGAPRDYAQSAGWVRKAAGQGDAKAQYVLGGMYRKGEGVPQDDAEAVRWFRKSAEQGLGMAQASLGEMYMRGQGVPRDDAEAVGWFRKAADQGDERAHAALAVLYYYGRGVPRNYAEAARWLGKVAADCFVRLEVAHGRWTSIVAIFLVLPMLFVPQRLWGGAAWLPWLLCSGSCAAMIVHILQLDRHVLWVTFFAAGSVYCAFGAVVKVRESKRR